ncbi:hypothetical protein F5884DRAFT_263726 [Xylogone sp. PMI_703]|nr:hypothetical protein F5884DRAFT_263726 [Xylogone sp. PMI_703]
MECLCPLQWRLSWGPSWAGSPTTSTPWYLAGTWQTVACSAALLGKSEGGFISAMLCKRERGCYQVEPLATRGRYLAGLAAEPPEPYENVVLPHVGNVQYSIHVPSVFLHQLPRASRRFARSSRAWGMANGRCRVRVQQSAAILSQGQEQKEQRKRPGRLANAGRSRAVIGSPAY